VLVECLAGGAFEHEALRYAHEALALDPYRETSYVRLMRLHMDRGNRAEALRVYEQCRAVLARDLGVTPSALTEATRHDVLEPDRGGPC
jgi:DNA-binding SARP family transcriptional activator